MRKNKFYFLLPVLSLCCIKSYSQIGIGVAVPNQSSVIELNDISKGLLIPRMTSSQRNAIINPAEGLQIYDLTTNSVWYFNGNFWNNTTVPDASSTNKGLVLLSGDLSGTAAVPLIANDAITSEKIKDNTILNIDLADGTGGIYKGSGVLTGDTIIDGGGNTLAITSSSAKAFSVDNTAFSVNAASHSVGIGTSNPNSKAILELSSITKGFLTPRMTSDQRNLIPSPAKGLIIYNTTTNCIEVYNGSQWLNTCSSIDQRTVQKAIGTIKYGLQTTDHKGWILLNGRAKSTLTASQKTNADALGIGPNLPDTRDRMPIGAGSSYLSLSSGGNFAITLSNLPNAIITGSTPYTPAGTITSSYSGGTTINTDNAIHSHPMRGNPGFNYNSASSFISFGYSDRSGYTSQYSNSETHNHTVNIPNVTSTFIGSTNMTINNIPLNNNQVQSSFIPPYIAFNAFLYLGI